MGSPLILTKLSLFRDGWYQIALNNNVLSLDLPRITGIYVQGFSNVAGPLHGLVTTLNKEIKDHGKIKGTFQQRWNETCDEAFNSLKDALTTAPILGYADYKQPFVVETYASHLGLGAVLSQDQNERRVVIGFASRRLRPPERKYSAMKLEMLALKWAVTSKFRSYLYGGEFVVYTDNNPLKYLRTAKLGAVEQRWAAELAPFNFSVEYRAGRSNANADALSRQTHDTAEELTDNDDDDDVQQICAVHAASTLLPSEVRDTTCTEAVPCLVKTDDESSADLAPIEAVAFETNQQDVSLVQPGEATPSFPSLAYAELGELQNKDEDLGRFLQFLRAGEKPKSHESRIVVQLVRQWLKFNELPGVLHRTVTDQKGELVTQLVLPSVPKSQFLEAVHDRMEHQGGDRTVQLAWYRCYWPGMHGEVDDYVKSCSRCTLAKMPSRRVHAPMGNLLASRPLEVVAVDYTHLEKSADGRDSVLVMTDVFTKYAWVVPTHDQKACTTAKVLVLEWFQRLGVPHRIHSDRVGTLRVRLFESFVSFMTSGNLERLHTTQKATGSANVLTDRYMTYFALCHWNRSGSGQNICQNCAQRTMLPLMHQPGTLRSIIMMLGRDPRLPVDALL